VSTGELVGFATWVLPEADVAGKDEDKAGRQDVRDFWPEARVPEVDDELLELLKKRYDEADWESDHATNALDPPVNELRAQLKGDKKWIGRYS